jgi:hypothetical protein
MNFSLKLIIRVVIASLLATSTLSLAAVAGSKSLPGHVPKIALGLTPQGVLPGTNQLRLAIGLSLRDPDGLNDFLGQLYDPASTNYQHYLNPEEFADRFGPTIADYLAVKTFAQTNHLTITAVHGNRLLLDVAGSAADIQRAFNLHLLSYHHPTESRDFYAPDADPSVAQDLPVADVSGLDNYALPHPHFKRSQAAGQAQANGTGSGDSGEYIGNDFRAAYVPGTSLTGAGQIVGLVQFDGFYASDISAYAASAGLSVVPLQTVLLDGFDGTPTTGPDSGNVEVSLDIEMAMSMAPGLSSIVVFEAGSSGIPNDVLNTMVASNQVRQLSCSWGWEGGPTNTTDAIFKEMAAQGQSFFTASGDGDAYTTGASSVNGVDNPSLGDTPSSNPYITVVGGTTLTTTGPGGAWASETVWNWGLDDGSYVGSSGGISSYYTIPSWQTGVSMSANGGSTTYRNLPDVALTADNVYVAYGDGTSESIGGTSCATPLWAGLAALINEQAVSAGKATIGFLNPALYALAKSSAYAATFHDITNGNNVSSDSPTEFYATNGFDLCTGWGTPAGQALINALSGVTNWLTVSPSSGFSATGPVGGSFSPNSESLRLSNSGPSSLTWSLVSTSACLKVSITNGTLSAGGAASTVVSLTASADNLIPGVYSMSLFLTNRGASLWIPFTLSIGQQLVENGGFEDGSFADWTFYGDTVDRRTTYDAVESSSSVYSDVVHSGAYGAFLGDVQLASLSQSFATVPGQYYWVSLWLNNLESGSGQQFIVNWIGNSAYTNVLCNLSSPGVLAWTNLQFLVVAAGTNTTLDIEAENIANYFGLDDISVLPVPAPQLTAVKSGHNFALSWATSTGLVYQVQYKTNLLQSSWTALNSSFTATNYSATAVDTNAVALSPRRFYRLGVAP